MTFTTILKEELSNINDPDFESRITLISFLKVSNKSSDLISISFETSSVVRRIYLDLKRFYNLDPTIKVRIQKRFKEKQIYILEIYEKFDTLISSLSYDDVFTFCDSDEEKISFLKGAFLAGGSITDPKNSGYHLEFSFFDIDTATDINNLLISFNINSKILKRGNKFIVYIKAAEEISDLLRMFKAVNSLFYFEDIRIYRDHKNKVNRLTNCEIANQEKTIQTALKHINSINFLRDNGLFDLLDEKSKIVISYREKYPDASFLEIADLISDETNMSISKSGVNHIFMRINKIVNKYKEGN